MGVRLRHRAVADKRRSALERAGTMKRQMRRRTMRRLGVLPAATLAALATLPATPAAAAPPSKAVALIAFVEAEAAQVAAQEAQAARLTNTPTTAAPAPLVTAFSRPVSIGGTLTAVAAFSTLGTADPVQVLTYRSHGWATVAALP